MSKSVLKRWILKSLYTIFYYLGVFKLFYFANRKSQLVITYHNVISDEIFNSDLLHLGVSCSQRAFVKQLDLLTSKFNVVTEVGIPRSCIITFDDGYKNNLEIAADHLTKKGVSGLFFIPAVYFDTKFDHNRILWVDKLLMWVSYAPVGSYVVLGNKCKINSSQESRRCLWEYLYPKLLSNYSILELLMRELDGQYSFNEFKKTINTKMYQSRFEAMTVSELNQLKEMGHKLACHSFQHDILSLLNDEQLEHDFLMCERYSKEYNSNYYSYPFGGEDEISPNVVNVCKKYAYSAAFVNFKTHNKDKYFL